MGLIEIKLMNCKKKQCEHSSIPTTEASVLLCSDDILANLLSLIPEADGTVKADSIFFYI